jgi:hypothetical protein
MQQRPGDFDKYVDTVLKHFKAGEAAPIFDGIDNVTDLAHPKTERLIFMSFLLEEGLLRDTGSGGHKDNPNVRITTKGYMITGLEGGWNEYIRHTKELDKLKNDLVSSSILTNQSSIRTNKTTKLILVITVFISALGASISWLNYDFVRTHQEPSRRTIDSLSNKLIEQQNLTLQDLIGILKADSLRNNLKAKK